MERELAAAYEAGRARGASSLAPEEVDASLVAEGVRLRHELLAARKDSLAGRGEAVFFCVPGGPGDSWFGDLRDALVHCGVPCAWSVPGDPALGVKLEVVRPTLVLAPAVSRYTDSPGRRAVDAWARASGAVRVTLVLAPPAAADGAVPAPAAGSPAPGSIDGSSDAHVAWFDARSWPDGYAAGAAAGAPVLHLPAAANPFTHRPLAGARDLDFFMVAAREADRVAVAHAYLRRIFREGFGLWAGPGWSFGEGPIAAAETPAFYARARIALNPLHRMLVAGPLEISQRTFAAGACGAFVLTDRTPVTGDFFAADELVAVDSAGAFGEAFDHYGRRPREREAVARRTMRRVFAEHTYLHRAGRLLTFVAEVRRSR